MSTTTGDNDSGHDFETELEVEVEAELSLAESSRPEEAAGLPVSEWPFDPADVQREEVELRNLLGADEELDGDSRPGRHGLGRHGTGEGACARRHRPTPVPLEPHLSTVKARHL